MAFPTRNTADTINYFREYRGAARWTDQEIKDNYQTRNLIPPPLFKPPKTQYTPLVPSFAQPARVLTQEEQGFLASTIPDLEDVAQTDITGGPGNWRGTKYLGSGSFGMVGLWEYQGPNPKTTKRRYVVVKQSSTALPGSMKKEGEFLIQLRVVGSPHIANVLNTPQTVNSQAENIDPAWDNQVRRLIMEYCSVGGLNGTLERFNTL
jgi:hypothetical protein